MIDELLLQKWVDGELSNDQIRDLLRDVDQTDQANAATHPQSAWKQVAVAFAENQIVHREFADLESRLNTNDDNPKLNQPADTHSSPNSPRGFWLMALAASLLLCFALIPSSRSGGPIQPEVASTVVIQDSTDSPTADPFALPKCDHRTLLTLTPDHHLESGQLPASLSGKVSQQVPLYDAERFDKQQLGDLRNNDVAARRAWANQVMPTSNVTDQMVSDYEKAGLMIDQDIEFFSGRLDDGRSYMIPYRTVRFIPGQ